MGTWVRIEGIPIIRTAACWGPLTWADVRFKV